MHTLFIVTFYIVHFFVCPYIFFQSVEEAECRKAYDSATESYMSNFDRSKPPEEVSHALF